MSTRPYGRRRVAADRNFMKLVQAYILRIAATAFLAALGALTGVIWLTQALREFDLLTTKGQSLIVFLTATGLSIPSLAMIIIPIALFIAVLYALNRLNGDSELVVMSAAGMSPSQLLHPFVILVAATALAVGALSIWVVPSSFISLRSLLLEVRADFLTRVVREGQFNTLDKGFVFHYRERGPGGRILGVFMQDQREADKVTSYVAESGVTAEVDGQPYLILEKGSVHRQARGSRDPAIVTFERYALDLAQFASGSAGLAFRPRERTTAQLLSLDRSEAYVAANFGRFRAELHDRFVSPLYALCFGLIGFAALGRPRTTRQGRGLAMAAAVAAVVALRVAGFGASAMAARSPWAVALVYGVPLIGVAASLMAIYGPPLGRYIRAPNLRLPRLPMLAR
jgi:lipopolysaccharide export system permease protein